MTQNGEKPGDEPASDDVKNAAPEVEAEIVEDGDMPRRQEAGETPTIEASDSPDAAALNDAPPKTALTPGVVLFLVFVIISALVFSLWRFQSGGEAAPQPSSPATADEAASSADDEAQAAIDAPGAGQTEIITTPPAPEETKTPDQTEAEAARPGAGEDIGETYSASDPEAPEADPGGDDAGAFLPPPSLPPLSLPPLPSAPAPSPPADETAMDDGLGAAENLQDGEPPASDNAPVFEIAEAPEPMVAPVEEAADLFAADPSAQGAAAVKDPVFDAVGAAPQSRTDPARIENNVEALKDALRTETGALAQALDEERRRSASQQDQIAALRREFEDALNQRDQRANAAISDLRARLDKIQSVDGRPSGREAAAAIALSGLARIADQGAPFEGEFEVLARLAPDAPALERLRSLAGGGAPTLSSLQESFAPAAVDALAAAGRARAGSLMGQFFARAQSLVSVRPANPQTGTTPRAIISRAEDRLDHDDLAAALAELDALEGPVRAAMAGWVGRAEHRARLARSVEELNAYFISRLQD